MNPRHCVLLTFPLHGVYARFKSFAEYSSPAPAIAVPSHSLPRGYYDGQVITKLTFSQDDVTAPEKLEPAFKSLLRSLKVNDAVMDAMRLNEITDRAVFTDLAQDEQQSRKCAKAFGIDATDDADFPPARDAKAQSDVKTAADAAARAHGEPFTILSNVTFGPDLCDNELPAKSYYEEFEESLAEGCLEAERLCEVVSEEESQEQRRLKHDPARQFGMHLEGKLTLQTRRRFSSVEAANQEQLRAKRTVLKNMWLLAHLRQPGRSIFRDLTRSTFDDHLRILLNLRNFNYRKEVDGQLLSQPCWSHCLSYELEVRKGAYQSIGITAALLQVATDSEHRTQHWVQLIAIANSSGANDAAESTSTVANVGASSSGKFLFSAKGVRLWKPKQEPAKSSSL